MERDRWGWRKEDGRKQKKEEEEKVEVLEQKRMNVNLLLNDNH